MGRRSARPVPLDRLDGSPGLRPGARGPRGARGLGVVVAAAAVASFYAPWAPAMQPARAARPPAVAAAVPTAEPAAPSVSQFLPPLVRRQLPVVTPAGSGPHTFIEALADGSPVRYDPCAAVHYVVNPDEAPANWQAVVEQSIASVSAATGLEFVYDGQVPVVPSDDRQIDTPDGWAPVLISWRTEAQYPDLAGDVVGESGSYPSADPATDPHTHFVSGQVVLDSVAFRRLASRGRRAEEQAITMHELGHVVGLDHVKDRHELMNPEYLGLDTWGPGDLEGLAVLGAGPCYRED